MTAEFPPSPISSSYPASLTPDTGFGEGSSLHLLRRIGQGGMGEVWLVHDEALGVDRAVKFLLPERGGDLTIHTRFVSEARTLAALGAVPGLVRVHAAGEDPSSGLPYFVMDAHLLAPDDIRRICTERLGLSEAVAGRLTTPDSPPRPFTLQDALGDETSDTARQLPECAVIALAREITATLRRLHAQGVVHRDLKPSNLLFAADGRLLLADFGIAKTLGSPHTRNTLSGIQPGSSRYAAPEQMDGRPATPAVDWYALGIVLYRALYSSFPEWGEDFPTLAGLRPVSPLWKPLLRDLLAKNPQRRLRDPDAILRTLDRIAHHPVRPRSRRRSRGWLMVLPLLAVLGGAIAFVLHPHGNREVPVQPGTESRKQETQPKDFSSPASAALRPPRLPSIWQGDDCGPLQLLNMFRLAAVDDIVDESLAQIDPAVRRLLQKGDNAWSATSPDIEAANRAYFSAASQLLLDIQSVADTNAPALRVSFAVAMARLSWTYVVSGRLGASNIPYQDALGAVTPLFESDAPRYAPLRSWLLAERAYMECMEKRFEDSANDLRESISLWAHYGYDPDDPGSQAQMTVLIASVGGMFRKVGLFDKALASTTEAIRHLSPLLPADGNDTPLSDLLAGCHYRQGELFRREGSRLDSLQSYRRALAIWRTRYRSRGESYRLTYGQALERVASAYGELGEMTEAIAAWDELIGLLRPLLESNPTHYAPIVAGIFRNTATAFRQLGNEDAAQARDAQADELLPQKAPSSEEDGETLPAVSGETPSSPAENIPAFSRSMTTRDVYTGTKWPTNEPSGPFRKSIEKWRRADEEARFADAMAGRHPRNPRPLDWYENNLYRAAMTLVLRRRRGQTVSDADLEKAHLLREEWEAWADVLQ